MTPPRNPLFRKAQHILHREHDKPGRRTGEIGGDLGKFRLGRLGTEGLTQQAGIT